MLLIWVCNVPAAYTVARIATETISVQAKKVSIDVVGTWQPPFSGHRRETEETCKELL